MTTTKNNTNVITQAIKGTSMKSLELIRLANHIIEFDYVEFTHEGALYYIEYSEANEGYHISVYPPGVDIENAEPEDEINGGLCTGSAIDAIGMFLPREQIKP